MRALHRRLERIRGEDKDHELSRIQSKDTLYELKCALYELTSALTK